MLFYENDRVSLLQGESRLSVDAKVSLVQIVPRGLVAGFCSQVSENASLIPQARFTDVHVLQTQGIVSGVYAARFAQSLGANAVF